MTNIIQLREAVNVSEEAFWLELTVPYPERDSEQIRDVLDL